MSNGEPHPPRRSYTLKVDSGNRKKKRNTKSSGKRSDRDLSFFELLVFYGIKYIFDVPYQNENRTRNLLTLLALSFIDVILLGIVLGHDNLLPSASYYSLKMSARYDSVPVFDKEISIGAFGYIVGGDQCDSASMRYDFSSSTCSSPHLALECRGYYVDKSESNYLQR